jgi:hypothetical protein
MLLLQTLGSFRPGGCTAAVAAQLALGLVNTWYAASIAWKQGGSSSSTARHSHSSGGSAGAQPLGVVPGVDGNSGGGVVGSSDSWMAAADGGGGGGGGAVREASAAIVSPRAGPPASLRSRGA